MNEARILVLLSKLAEAHARTGAAVAYLRDVVPHQHQEGFNENIHAMVKANQELLEMISEDFKRLSPNG